MKLLEKVKKLHKHDEYTYFPFPVPRDQQVLAIERVKRAFDSNKKFVIIEAGTGVGKSAIGVAINRLMLSMEGKKYKTPGEFEPGAYFLTTLKISAELRPKNSARAIHTRL